jgi:PKD repeat protein
VNNNNSNIWNNIVAGNFWDDMTYWDDSDCNGICDDYYTSNGVNDYKPLYHYYGSIVNQNTGEIFLTIQEAIDDSDTVFGDTIFVYEDIYYENIVFSKSGITLLGEDKNNTYIDASYQEMNAVLIKNQSNNTLNGFTISFSPKTNELSSNGILIWAYSDDPLNCTANNNIITNCIIEYNDGYGVLILASGEGQKTDSNIISNCEIYSNGYCGIRVTNDYYSSDGWQDHTMAAVSISPNGKTTNTTIQNCLFYFSNGYDIHVEGNIIENNLFYHNNFLSNLDNVYDEGQNIWYNRINETSGEGNYWACFDETSEGAIDTDSDGIIDNPYDITGGNNQDLYPLSNPLFNIALPIAEANGPYNAEINQTINFDATGSYDPDGIIVNYLWNLGNGKTISTNIKNIYYTYTSPGEYTITLTVTDSHGLTKTDTTTTTIIESSDEETPPENETENLPPIADAGGPYYGFTDESIFFDSSDSYDLDGTNLTYSWDFGDESTSTDNMPTHSYIIEGSYTITLTVKDEDNATDIDETIAIITKKPNKPPNKPILYGPTTGHINTTYNYTVIASDPDGDRLQYILNWDDETQEMISPFLNSSKQFNTTHKWSTGGIYIITYYTLDENNATSSITEYKVMIDAYYCGSLGYLIDKNGDGIYDVFYREETDKETTTQKNNSEYYIDINEDKEWDYIYNFTTKTLQDFKEEGIETSRSPLNFIYLLVVIFGGLTAIIATKILLNRKSKRYDINNKINQEHEKSIKQIIVEKELEISQKDRFVNTTKFNVFNPKDEEIEKMHNDIDKLLSKKEK